MDTRISWLRLVRMSPGLLVLFVALGVVGISTGFAEEESQTPWIRISTSNEYLRADGFVPGASLTFQVFETPDTISPVLVLTRQVDEAGVVFVDGWEHDANLEPGNYVTASDGINARALLLEPLTIDTFDPQTDFVAGTATSLEPVQVVVGNDVIGYPASLDVQADLRGTWEADFAGSFDFDWEMWGSALVFDEDWDATVYHLGPTTPPPPPPPSPNLRAFPDADYVDGYYWPAEQSVRLEVGERVFNAPADGDGAVGFELGPYDLLRGDLLRMSSGDLVVEHVVKMLFIDEIDTEFQFVAGTVDGQETVHVFSGLADEYVFSNGSGEWSVDLSGYPEKVLYPGACVSAEAWDTGTDNSTIVQLCIPEPPPVPFIWADPLGEFINGWDWPAGSEVGLQVSRNGANLHSETQQADESGAVGFDLNAAEIDLQAGDQVVMQDGVTTKELWVTDLAITQISVSARTISGVYDPMYSLRIQIEGLDADQLTFLKNEWTAAFADMGQGECGEVSQPDDDGDQTGFGFCTPNPWFGVFPEQEVVEGWEWAIGEIVHLEIDGVSGHFETDGEVVPAEWDGVTPWLWIDFASEHDVQAGDEVTLSGNSGTNWHVVRALEVTGTDPRENTITGTADPGAEVRIRPHVAEQTLMTVTANTEGIWFADLDDVGYDLMAGEAVRASIADERNNETAVDRDVWLPIQIDIKPFNSLNQVACRFASNLIPVALLSSDDFDAAAVDPGSIGFGRTGFEAGVVRLGWDKRPARYVLDVNGDGLMDVIYYFRLGDTGFSCADIPAGKYSVRVDAVLTGWTADFGVWGVDFLRLYRLFD